VRPEHCGWIGSHVRGSGLPFARDRTDWWTISPQSDSCSSASPAPVGKNTCGPTVHALGGPAVAPGRSVLPGHSGHVQLAPPLVNSYDVTDPAPRQTLDVATIRLDIVQGEGDALAREILDILFRHDPLGTAYDPECDRTEYWPETRSMLTLLDATRSESDVEAALRQAFEASASQPAADILRRRLPLETEWDM
jgi:hypothetical protein